jgi:hypothetical protein
MSIDMDLYRAAGRITAPGERERIAQRREAVERVRAAGRGATVDVMAAEARALGVAYSTLRSLYYAWQRRGDDALLDGRKVGKVGGANHWVGIYKRYCEADKNTSANAHRTMMSDFRAGVMEGLPGAYAEVWSAIGTWREVWAKEHTDQPVPEAYPSGWVPEGATYQTLMRAASRDPDRMFQIVATRQGRRAAHRFLLDVIKTRVGVPIGGIRQWDDVWHNFDIRLPGSPETAQPLEFAGYDVASAYKCDSAIKPRFTRQDGKRDNLKEQTFRFVFGASHCVTGFNKNGITNIVEHGTAAIRDNVRRQIALIPHYGGLIQFAQSGILSEQVHAGLFIGGAGGNFRMKPLIESSHGKLADRTAHMIGNRGRDAETMHESRNALVRYEERIMAAAAKLAPDVAAMIEYGLMSFDDYVTAYRVIERAFFGDPIHRLEGWDGNQIQEYSVVADPSDADWHNGRDLLDMDPAQARAIAAFLQAHPQCVRQRFMSRYEVWMTGRADQIRVPIMEMPAFLDERDMIELTVRDNGTVDFANGYFYGRDKMIYRVDAVRTPAGYVTRLAPGAKVMVKYNPFASDQIWIIDRESGSTVGTAPLHERAPMMDRVAIERAMGLQSHDLARKVMPVRGRHQPEAVARAARMGRNQAALLGLATELPMNNQTVSDDAGDGEVCDLEDLTSGRVPERYEDGADEDAQDEALAMISQCR